jgi:hypothetical protein
MIEGAAKVLINLGIKAKPEELAEVLTKPKPKKVMYKKKLYYYTIKMDEEGKPLEYIFFDQSDPELEKPIGYVLTDPVSKLPKGEILPMQAE